MKVKKGFTLIEVLIVVIILGILATIAIPQFAKMTKKARLAEAWTNLAAIRTAQSVYYLEQDKYTTAINQLDGGTESSLNFNYTVTVSGATYNAIANGTNLATGVSAWMTEKGVSGSSIPD